MTIKKLFRAALLCIGVISANSSMAMHNIHIPDNTDVDLDDIGEAFGHMTFDNADSDSPRDSNRLADRITNSSNASIDVIEETPFTPVAMTPDNEEEGKGRTSYCRTKTPSPEKKPSKLLTERIANNYRALPNLLALLEEEQRYCAQENCDASDIPVKNIRKRMRSPRAESDDVSPESVTTKRNRD